MAEIGGLCEFRAYIRRDHPIGPKQLLQPKAEKTLRSILLGRHSKWLASTPCWKIVTVASVESSEGVAPCYKRHPAV